MDKEQIIVEKIMKVLDQSHCSHEVALSALFKAFNIAQMNIIKMEAKGTDTDQFYRGLKMTFINHMDQSYNRYKMNGGFVT